MRVVSLLPGATELVAALGVDPVGVSHECDHPPRVSDVPAVNDCRIDPDGSPAEVDQAVAAAAESGGVYDLDRERLAALDPDLVVTQAVCDVCALDQVIVRDAVDELDLDATVLTVDVHTLSDLFETVRRLGDALDRRDAADDLVADLRARTDAVQANRPPPADRPRVAVLDWPDPPMVAGHWVPELVTVAGGTYGLAEPGAHSRPHEWREIRDYDPEVLVLAPCGFPLGQTLDHLDSVTGREGWADLTAVREGRVYAMDGHHYVNRAGPRLVDTCEYLSGVIHPDRYDVPPVDVVRDVSV